MGYLLLPLAFFIIGNLFLYCVLEPFINVTLNVWSMFSADFEPDDEGIYNDIFTESSLSGYEGTIPASQITYPAGGTKYGEINIHTNNTVYSVPLIYGDSNVYLRKGAGQYMGSHFPGEGSTILVCGHNTTHFNCLKYAQVGEIIEVKTSYGNFRYEVTDVSIKHKTDTSAFDLESEKEYLVLYTCYPFDVVGYKVNRYYVTAILVSGPKIDPYN